MKLTEPQNKALAYLAKVSWADPSEIGRAMGHYSGSQRLGLIGGAMAARLIKMGLAEHAWLNRGRWTAYKITDAGLKALMEQDGEA